MDLVARYQGVRNATEALASPLSPEDCTPQSMTDASPIKWHLAHTSWFFETFLLERELPDYEPFDSDFRVLFNSYYHGIGEQHPRPERGLLTRPSLDDVFAYRSWVDRRMDSLMEEKGADARLGELVRLGLEHEQQHQELMLTDVKHLFAHNPMHPRYSDCPPPEREHKPLSWHHHPGGASWLGDAGEDFAFDNERPRHCVFLNPFEIASRLVTNSEFLAFMGDDGYERPELWLSDGWAVVRERGWRAPLYWERDGADWQVRTLGGLRPLCENEPVCHVSYYEADAFARWAAARLPAEAEWEAVAGDRAVQGNFVESDFLHPAAVAPEALGEAPAQLFGDVWEWTASPYVAYPGFRPLQGAAAEYNGKFMANQVVLRGGSCATPREHVRASYRNFFYPDARWQFSGLRLARDAQ